MSTQKRKYELKARAESQRRTRERIVEATMELHEEVGPAKTTIAEIARRAGVQRLTVYNHFPDETRLFNACGAHWRALNPLPDLSGAMALEDPRERVREALEALYGWYRSTEPMTENIQRDRLADPALDAVAAESVDAGQAQLAEALAAGFEGRGRRADARRALTRVALDFWTWRRLDREGLDDAAAARLMANSVACAGAR